MGTAKNGEQNNNGVPTPATANGSSKPKTEEVDQYPEGTRLGHYVLGKLAHTFPSFQMVFQNEMKDGLLMSLNISIGKALGKGTFGKVKMANH